MNTKRLVGHAIGSVAFTALWEVCVSLPAGSPGWRLIAFGLLPQAVAGISVGLQELADHTGGKSGYERAARPVTGEIVRPPTRRELAR